MSQERGLLLNYSCWRKLMPDIVVRQLDFKPPGGMIVFSLGLQTVLLRR